MSDLIFKILITEVAMNQIEKVYAITMISKVIYLIIKYPTIIFNTPKIIDHINEIDHNLDIYLDDIISIKAKIITVPPIKYKMYDAVATG